ncbi:hypothetical protein L1283_003229 [Sphingobacterium sp. HSC-15S19]
MIPSKADISSRAESAISNMTSEDGQPLKITNWYSATFLFKSAKTAFKQRKM